MARTIINANEHLVALGKASRSCVLAATRYAQVSNSSRIHLFAPDIDRIASELKGCGFDIGRGFKICGKKVIPVSPE